jgi:hypothetical protein
MHVRELMGVLAERGYPVNSTFARDTIQGVLGRKARAGDTFAHVGPGRFGLLDWSVGSNGDAPSETSIATTAQPTSTSAPRLNQTAGLIDVIRRYPGRTSTEIASIYSNELGEHPDMRKRQHNSRVTRIAQLASAKRIRKDGDLYFPNLPEG